MAITTKWEEGLNPEKLFKSFIGQLVNDCYSDSDSIYNRLFGW